ncbi:unnamed protein product [Gongylonema pulchrum]|uniref:Uncharacterized protein n=1 Tax=Gongylonema pulchrum TaxID=637853 RepID=A0A183E618_9BILA|nr:unnamed protein product [Gongylonema pulchrum]
MPTIGAFIILFGYVQQIDGHPDSLLIHYVTDRQKQQLRGNSTSSGAGEAASHWATLKMMMAERAAHCLAKLGLDAAATTTATTTTTTNTSTTNSIQPETSESQNVIASTDSTTTISSTTPNDLVTPFGHHRRFRYFYPFQSQNRNASVQPMKEL